MAAKLKLRKNVWYVEGVTRTREGHKVYLRKTTGCVEGEKALATVKMGEILNDVYNGRMVGRNTGGTFTVGDAAYMFIRRPNPPGQTDYMIMRGVSAALGGIVYTELTVGDVMGYVNGRGNSAGTVGREINSVRAMLKHTESMGVETPRLMLVKPRIDDARSRWLTEEERGRVIDCCDDVVRHIVIFMFFTGCRVGEALGLEWSDYDSGDCVVRLKSRKGGKRRVRTIPLVREARFAMIDGGGVDRNNIGNGKVFRGKRKKKLTYAMVQRRFGLALDEAGIEDFRIHDIRHTFASLLVQKGASLRAVGELLGHSSVEMVARYSHLAPSHLGKTIELLGDRGRHGEKRRRKSEAYYKRGKTKHDENTEVREEGGPGKESDGGVRGHRGIGAGREQDHAADGLHEDTGEE